MWEYKKRGICINACLRKSPLSFTHKPLQCFSLLHFLPLYLSRSISYTCTKLNGVTTHPLHAHTHMHAHTPPRHLSVQRPVSLALGAVGSKRVKEKVSLGSVVLNPTSSLFSPAVLLSIKWSHNITLSAHGLSLLS